MIRQPMKRISGSIALAIILYFNARGAALPRMTVLTSSTTIFNWN